MVDGVRVSSTAVREALAAGDLTGAQRLLGRPYSISGRVVRGDGLGRKLGFPTANVLMKHNRPPLSGIFAVEVHGIVPQPLRGVASLGVRPTVTQHGRSRAWRCICSISNAIFTAGIVRVDFLHKLRDEEKYADVADAEHGRSPCDVENARAYFYRRDARDAKTAAEWITQ